MLVNIASSSASISVQDGRSFGGGDGARRRVEVVTVCTALLKQETDEDFSGRYLPPVKAESWVCTVLRSVDFKGPSVEGLDRHNMGMVARQRGLYGRTRYQRWHYCVKSKRKQHR